MEQKRCGNCMYGDLASDAEPCKDCSRYFANSSNKLYWMPEIEKIEDPFERMGAILKNQTYIMLEIGHLREELNKFKE